MKSVMLGWWMYHVIFKNFHVLSFGKMIHCESFFLVQNHTHDFIEASNCCTYMYMYVHMYTYIYIYIHTYISTYIKKAWQLIETSLPPNTMSLSRRLPTQRTATRCNTLQHPSCTENDTTLACALRDAFTFVRRLIHTRGMALSFV